MDVCNESMSRESSAKRRSMAWRTECSNFWTCFVTDNFVIMIVVLKSMLRVLLNTSTNSSYDNFPESSVSMSVNKLSKSSRPILIDFNISFTEGFTSTPAKNSSREIDPLPSESIAPSVSRHARSAWSPFRRFRSSCFALLLSRASAALSTITARIKFVNPNCTVTRATANKIYVAGCLSMIGRMQAPQESPATSVWKNRSVDLATEENAVAQ
mmetsp:Transcript_100756/g.291314  ORF Transcript_100756/g.291314 Transcript_100756/m.291314 type:complete len:213 (+) Transcript_100756:828-1466(+)